MEESGHTQIGEAVLDPSFPEVDLALRRGRHIDREDGPWYTFLLDAQAVLEEFYRRFGCELVHRTDGYFYLLPSGDRLPRRQLSTAEMIVGQGLALLYLDPGTIESGGLVQRATLLGSLATVMGADALAHAMGHKRRRSDERLAQQNVRRKVAAALRRLAGLGFVELVDEEGLRLRPALMRFAEPVRGAGSPTHALELLIAKGEVVLGGEEASEDDLDDDDDLEDEDDSGAEESEGDEEEPESRREPAGGGDEEELSSLGGPVDAGNEEGQESPGGDLADDDIRVESSEGEGEPGPRSSSSSVGADEPEAVTDGADEDDVPVESRSAPQVSATPVAADEPEDVDDREDDVPAESRPAPRASATPVAAEEPEDVDDDDDDGIELPDEPSWWSGEDDSDR